MDQTRKLQDILHNTNNEYLKNRPFPCRQEMDVVFKNCRNNKWARVLQALEENPLVGIEIMTMDNHISTTVLHQAITSKGDVGARSQVMFCILHQSPEAATIKNGYGSLPLHVACQRNVKLDASTKEKVIHGLIVAYPEACVTPGGVGKRTPLHILFTDYISPRLTCIMIQHGPQACFLRDKNGMLPAHVACSRHCSPEKLRMLLQVNPKSLYETTCTGQTLLSLAKSTATKTHPNYALIDELHAQLGQPKKGKKSKTSTPPFMDPIVSPESIYLPETPRDRMGSNDSSAASSWTPRPRMRTSSSSDVEMMTSPDRKRAYGAVDLLLHFANTGREDAMDDEDEKPSAFAAV